MKALLSFEEANQLLDEVIAFLVDCGGVYEGSEHDGELQARVLECLALGQYLVHRDPRGAIQLFVCYWMLTGGAAEALTDRTKPRPVNVTRGNVMFVVEHGNKSGRAGMIRMISELREKEPQTEGTAWRHKGQSFRFFPTQRSLKCAANSDGAADPTGPLEDLEKTMKRARLLLHKAVMRAKNAPAMTREMELKVMEHQELLVRECVRQVAMVMNLNRELRAQRDKLAAENKEVWEAMLSGKVFTCQGKS